ncbi:MAG TPA: hypothetical protein VLK53_00415 [Gaiellaceae bacterium]|nr:hypothetical protein [Gaiellaceae bacterium]
MPPGPESRRTAHAEEAGTIVLAIGATAGMPYEADGWLELWGPVYDLYQAGDYEGVRQRPRGDRGAPATRRPAVQPRLRGEPRRAHAGLAPTPAYGDRAVPDLARGDADFDAIRDEPGFRELVG